MLKHAHVFFLGVGGGEKEKSGRDFALRVVTRSSPQLEDPFCFSNGFQAGAILVSQRVVIFTFHGG